MDTSERGDLDLGVFPDDSSKYANDEVDALAPLDCSVLSLLKRIAGTVAASNVAGNSATGGIKHTSARNSQVSNLQSRKQSRTVRSKYW